MSDPLEQRIEQSKTNIITRPQTSVFHFCNKVIEADYFTFRYRTDDNGNQIIERVPIELSCRDRYPKVTTTLTRRERRHWRIERFRIHR
jgi:hypothetical protein